MQSEPINPIRLLLVDDEADFRNTLAKRLLKRGIAAQQAGSGEACLDLIADHPMDVVVMDVKMPGMNGIEALEHIRRRCVETEVILLTGHAATQDGVDGIKSGAFDYLTKPVEFDHLLSKIVQAYDKILAEREKAAAAEYKARIEQQMIATERLAALGTLAAGVAHEINNPLAIINEAAGLLGTLLCKGELADMPHRATFEKALQKIDRSVKRAGVITHQLLRNVRKSESVLAEVDVLELVNESVDLVHKTADDKNVVVAVQPAGEVGSIWADANQIRQVLINLLSNAIHATDCGGTITIQVSPDERGVAIAVIDTGHGIPKENLEKIFEPFFSTKAPGEGTGLGLFVTREIVDKLGGSLVVDSRVGHGTRFTVQLPDRPPSPRPGSGGLSRSETNSKERDPKGA
jgi:signal transduction histidine kinase